MPLDVRIVRGEVTWTSAAAAAFRHGVQDLEDHLLGMGIDDAELDVRVRANQGGGDIHAVLRIGEDRLDVNGEDPDLGYALTSALERLRELASPQRVLVDDGRGPTLGADAPWEDMLSTVVAMATHLVTRAVDHGDLPPGAVDPRDLADDAIADLLEDKDRSMRALRKLLAQHLEKRIVSWSNRADDLELDAARPSSEDGDEPPDEAYTAEDLLDPDAALSDDDRVPPRPDR